MIGRCSDIACLNKRFKSTNTMSKQTGMRINRELNLVFPDRATVQKLESTIFLPDFCQSKRILPYETEGIANSVAETLADQL